ncbi:MAG TPA: hypothetical protein VNX01_09215 [Bacteroidia bacterium]|nr:hypothetical protein [Bacteroidia bacterium]
MQDRFEILIKRQRNGVATFTELTELDEIVNRDPELRERVIRESIFMEGNDEYDEPLNEIKAEESPIKLIQRRTLLSRLKELVVRIFNFNISAIKAGALICT